ncbi:serine/threonine-protein kinase [Actinomadura macrotermitis]|uniref:serine/threonine-protein kinase n=1 Tax=Actinomadura macrotermitis TaxID=2585200 RepID=UPI001A9BDDBE|nr:serine/threonine-protein kinase [Actinomadura macrotermitis]
MPEEWRVGGFTEVRELGAGAFGRVVLARHDASGRPVAIKYLLTADAGAVAALRREAELLGRVQSPHVVRLYQFATSADGRAAIVMEAVNGVTLKRVLEEHGRLTPEASLVVLKGSLLGLDAAHRLGVVHRDYKPANVLVQGDGLSKLADFGVATHAGQASGAGTPLYMAPEQWQRQAAGPEADVYAATAVFYQCVTGRPPFAGGSQAALMHAHLSEPVPLDDIPEPLRRLVWSGLAKRPEERPPVAGDFAAALEDLARTTYGAGWEHQGIRALATGAAALAAAFPLAAAGLGTGGAAGAGAGAAGAGAAGAGGASAAGSGGGAMAAVGGTKVVAGVALGAVALGGGGVAAYQVAKSKPKQRPAVQQVAAVTTPVSFSNPDSGMFATGAQIITVKGLRDTALQARVNQALRKPVDDFLAQERKDWASIKGGSVAPQWRRLNKARSAIFKGRAGLAGPRYVSAAYDMRRWIYAGGGSMGQVRTVTVDLQTGKTLQSTEMFQPAALTPAGVRTFNQRVPLPANMRPTSPNCDYSLVARTAPNTGREIYGADTLATRTLLTKQGVEFLFGGNIGGECSAYGWTPMPWAKVGDLLNPEVIKAAR